MGTDPQSPRTLQPDFDFRRDPKTACYCVVCQKDIAPSKPCRWVFLRWGVDRLPGEIVHPEDVHLHVPSEEEDIGWARIGSECLRKIGKAWSTDAPGKPEPDPRVLYARWQDGQAALDALRTRYFGPAWAAFHHGDLDAATQLGSAAEAQFRAEIGDPSVLWIALDAAIRRVQMLERLRNQSENRDTTGAIR